MCHNHAEHFTAMILFNPYSSSLGVVLTLLLFTDKNRRVGGGGVSILPKVTHLGIGIGCVLTQEVLTSEPTLLIIMLPDQGLCHKGLLSYTVKFGFSSVSLPANQVLML